MVTFMTRYFLQAMIPWSQDSGGGFAILLPALLILFYTVKTSIFLNTGLLYNFCITGTLATNCNQLLTLDFCCLLLLYWTSSAFFGNNLI